jgi:hypothetical protein
LTSPDINTLSRSLETLLYIGILNEESNLTEIGFKACEIPIDPRLSVALINSAENKFKCSEELLIICSMLSVQNLFYTNLEPSVILKSRQKYGVIEGDHLTFLSIFKNWKNLKTSKSTFCKEIHINENSIKQVDEILNNLKFYLKKYNYKEKSSIDEDGEDILKCLLKGYFLNIAQKQIDGSYRSLKNQNILYIHPTSVLYTILPEYVFFTDVILSAKNYILNVSKIEKEWILEIGSNCYFDKTKNLITEKHRMEVKSQLKNELTNKQKNHIRDNGNEIDNRNLKFGKFSSSSDNHIKNKKVNIDNLMIMECKSEEKIFDNNYLSNRDLIDNNEEFLKIEPVKKLDKIIKEKETEKNLNISNKNINDNFNYFDYREIFEKEKLNNKISDKDLYKKDFEKEEIQINNLNKKNIDFKINGDDDNYLINNNNDNFSIDYKRNILLKNIENNNEKNNIDCIIEQKNEKNILLNINVNNLDNYKEEKIDLNNEDEEERISMLRRKRNKKPINNIIKK